MSEMTVGEKIKSARKKAGMTQTELGLLLRVSGSMVGQWENGIRNPKPSTLEMIAQVLDIPIVDLLSDYIDPYTSSKKAIEALQRGELVETPWEVVYKDVVKKRQKRLLEYYKCLSDEGQEVAISLVKSLALNPEYKRYTAQEAPEPPATAQPSTDTPNEEKPPEGHSGPKDGK